VGFFTKSDVRAVPTSTPPEGVYPICPFCEQRVDLVYTEQINMSLGKTWMFFCPKCSKVLGTSQRKTVPMG